MLEIFQFIAVLSGTLFTGAAIYINLVEHPARMGCGTELAITEWAPSYNRATGMQVPLAIGSTIAGAGSWFITGNLLWLLGTLLIFAVIPFTFIAIMPTNKLLLDPGIDKTSPTTRALPEKWGTLHGVRSILSLVASALFLIQVLRS
ncbi:MAG: DUF1772 domain-containing protein [Deltaproteobacteria bacterium]|nr:DUF1772 domain-containing protein [Deltaproteobacteria bacterium]